MPNSLIQNISTLHVYTFLESIIVDENNPIYSLIDGVLYNKDLTELIMCLHNKTGSFLIPKTQLP